MPGHIGARETEMEKHISGFWYGQWYPIEDVNKLPVGDFFYLGWAGASRTVQAYRVVSGWKYLYLSDEEDCECKPTHFMIIKGPKAPDPFEAFCENHPWGDGYLGIPRTHKDGRSCTDPVALDVAKTIWDAAKEAKPK